jgi:hypothetical protein
MLKCLEKKKTNFNVVVLPLSNNDLKEQDDILYNIPTLSDISKTAKTVLRTSSVSIPLAVSQSLLG